MKKSDQKSVDADIARYEAEWADAWLRLQLLADGEKSALVRALRARGWLTPQCLVALGVELDADEAAAWAAVMHM